MTGNAWERTVREAVESLRYGSVEVLVHDGRVVQVETRRKVRFPQPRPTDERGRTENDPRRAHRKAGGTAPFDDEENNE
jgi:hypothetical protein